MLAGAAGTVDEVTVVGLFLTLVSLLASLFWVSLTAWIRELTELHAESKYLMNRDEREEMARVRHRHKGLGDPTVYITALTVLVFGVVLLVIAMVLTSDISGSLANLLLFALVLFATVFVFLTLGLLARGRWLLQQIEANAG